VTAHDIVHYATSLRGGSAPGVDGMSADFLKQNLNIFVYPLLHIINLSLSSGIFPCIFKIAKVFPLHKASDFNDVNNYRPISMLSVFSKILERIVKDQFVSYIQENNILNTDQYGFIQTKNLSDALFDISKEINNYISQNKRCMLIFLDLKKAFDSVDRLKLLSKLEHIGVRGVAYSWFHSYLSERKQCVVINNISSDTRSIDYGVIQGSTLGPILFLIYINNISKLNLRGKLFLFADYTLILENGTNWENVRSNASYDLMTIKKWFDENVLSLNVSKTKFLPISLRNNSDYNLQDLIIHSCGDLKNINCSCSSIAKVSFYKYLGVFFDNRMRWTYHIDFLTSKLRKYVYAFRQL